MKRNYNNSTIGSIITENINYAKVFQAHGLDYCFGGEILLFEAIKKHNLSKKQILEELHQIEK